MTYVLLFVTACVILFIGVPAVSRWEQRRDEQDREFYARQFGGQR